MPYRSPHSGGGLSHDGPPPSRCASSGADHTRLLWSDSRRRLSPHGARKRGGEDSISALGPTLSMVPGKLG